MPGTIRVLKERGTDSRRVFYVTFDGGTGERWGYMIATETQAAGEERVCGSAGGSGEGRERNLPWANLGYGWGGGALYAAGRVIGAGAENAATVSLVFADRVVHDDTSNGVSPSLSRSTSCPRHNASSTRPEPSSPNTPHHDASHTTTPRVRQPKDRRSVTGHPPVASTSKTLHLA